MKSVDALRFRFTYGDFRSCLSRCVPQHMVNVAFHSIDIELVKPTAIVCSFDAAIPKGSAKLSVSVLDDETHRVRATATRKVRVV